MSAKHLFRSVAFSLLLVGGSLATGCAAAPEEDDGAEAGKDAITRDERVTRYVTRDFASTSPAETGVDAWDLATVENTKTGQSYMVLIALSKKNGVSRPLFELVRTAESDTIEARTVDAEGSALSLRKERMKAIRRDVEALRDAMEEKLPSMCGKLKKGLVITSLAGFAVALGTGALCVAGGVTPAAPVVFPLCYAAVFGGGLAGMWSGGGALYCSF